MSCTAFVNDALMQIVASEVQKIHSKRVAEYTQASPRK